MIHLRARRPWHGPLPVVLIVAALSLAGCGTAVPAASPVQAAGCSVVTRADVPIEIANSQIAVTALVNERPVRLRVATGIAPPLILTSRAARPLGLPQVGRAGLDPASPQRVEMVEVARFSLGAIEPRRTSAFVVETTFDAAGQPGDGVLGWGYLGNFDVEIDPAARRLRLHAVTGCDDRFVPFAEHHFSLPLRRSDAGLPQMPVRIDGTECLVRVSTGVDVTLVTRDAARRVGMSEAELAAAPQITATSLSEQRACPAPRFGQVEIGEHVFRDVRLMVLAAAPGQEDGAIGADYLSRQRVWISPSTGRIFIARRGAESGG